VRYLTPARPRQEDIELVENSSDGLQDVRVSIEKAEQSLEAGFLSNDDDEYKIEERTSKRRRRSSSSMLLDEEEINLVHEPAPVNSSPPPILSSPASRPIQKRAPKFIISTTAPPSTPHAASTQPTFLKPPRFRPPDPDEQSPAQADPLPEQFSPHRRGQKYIPGGLASEVRDWLMNIESTTPTAAQKKDEPWLIKLVIDNVSGGGRAGMTLVRGRKVHSAESMIDSIGVVKVLLAGEGAGTGLQRGKKVEEGMTVGIKGPVWEIIIEGEKWGVGVDWMVID
jgi:hypothetical protein